MPRNGISLLKSQVPDAMNFYYWTSRPAGQQLLVSGLVPFTTKSQGVGNLLVSHSQTFFRRKLSELEEKKGQVMRD